MFGRGETRALPSSVQATTPSITSSSSHDNFLSEAFRSTPRPLPYDADPRHFRSLVSRREKGSSHSHEEAEPLRSDSDADSESFGCKWANNKSVISEKDPKEEYSSKSSLRIMKSKSASGNIWDFPLSEDEDACPTCLEGYFCFVVFPFFVASGFNIYHVLFGFGRIYIREPKDCNKMLSPFPPWLHL